MRILSVLFSLLLITGFTYGQNGGYSTNSRKAIKYYEEGENELKFNRNYEMAQLNFQLAIDADPKFIEAHVRLAYSFQLQGKVEETIESLKNVVTINASYRPNLIYALAETEMGLGRYDDAAKHYRMFIPFGSRMPDLMALAELDLKKIEFAKKAMENPVDFDPKNMGEAINSELDEYFPCITVDQSNFLYTRKLEGYNTPTGYNEDFFLSLKDNEWSKSLSIGSPINTIQNEGAPTLSADGNVLIFTACEIYGDYGEGRRGKGSCDLFVTQRVGNNWTRPVNLGAPINTRNWESQPSLSADGQTLYFVRGIRSRGGQVRDQDIYESKLKADGTWSEPKKLNDNINTPFREETVFIHPNGRTLFFGSTGHIGMGGLDLFKSEKGPDGEWGPPENLGYPINTYGNENSILVNADGEVAYFSSSRENGFGGLDLYQFELPKSIRISPVSYFKGKVYDAQTKEPLYAKFELIDLETGELAVRAYSNKGTGEFLLALPSGKNYALNASKSGYLFYSDNFFLKQAETSDPFKKNVPMEPIKVGATTVLNNIFFDTDKYDLKPESRVELSKLITFLNDNPGVSIELSGHTDNVGEDSYNQKLSENRAKAVYDYLLEQGIVKERLNYKGYGESKPVADNNSESGRAKNRRTEFKIIENKEN